jgi:hypothetical protein
MLAQRLLVDLQLLGDVGLSDAKSRGVLNERALVCGRHIFGWHFLCSNLENQMKSIGFGSLAVYRPGFSGHFISSLCGSCTDQLAFTVNGSSPLTLWLARLSMTTISPCRKVGARKCST